MVLFVRFGEPGMYATSVSSRTCLRYAARCRLSKATNWMPHTSGDPYTEPFHSGSARARSAASAPQTTALICGWHGPAGANGKDSSFPKREALLFHHPFSRIKTGPATHHTPATAGSEAMEFGRFVAQTATTRALNPFPSDPMDGPWHHAHRGRSLRRRRFATRPICPW